MKKNSDINVSHFFKAYDLRATTPALSWQVYYLAGQALVSEILEKEKIAKKVVVWRDTRLSSPLFYKAFVSGLLSRGCDVIACGLGSTDMMYASCLENGCAGAIITASHNPKDDNGLKIVKKAPQMLGLAGGLDKIRDYVVENIDGFSLEASQLEEVSENITNRSQAIAYLEGKMLEISEGQTNLKNLKIVVDAANGMGSLTLKSLEKCYPNINFIPLYCELDGNFPNHPADPLNPTNLLDLQKAVLANGANLGIAFDGDADRAFFVDELGKAINGENLVAVFAKAMVEDAQTRPEIASQGLVDTVCYVISYSRALADVVSMANGVPVVCKQGHTFVKSQMAKYNAIYGGEASGHHYFGQFGFLDSGVLAFSLLLKIMAKNGGVASEITKKLDNLYFTLGETNYKMKPGMDLAKVKEVVKSQYLEENDYTISELDGITVYSTGYKFTIRGSNTEPLLRVNIESRKNQDQVQEVIENLIKILDL